MFSAKNAANYRAPPVLKLLSATNSYSITPPDTLLTISAAERSVNEQFDKFNTDICECSIKDDSYFIAESPNSVPDKFKSVSTLHVSIILLRHAY